MSRKRRFDPIRWPLLASPFVGALLVVVSLHAAPASKSTKDADKHLVGSEDGTVFNEGAAERRAGQRPPARSNSTCSGVDLVVKKVKIRWHWDGYIAVSATLANRCTGETTAETHWSVVSNADPAGAVEQSCSLPGVGLRTWEMGALVVPAKPRDEPTVVTVKIDSRNTERGERSETNNVCVATLPANTKSYERTCLI